MIDFWFSTLLTLIVGVATILADVFAKRLVSAEKAVSTLEHLVDQAVAQQEQLIDSATVSAVLDRRRRSTLSTLFFGDLIAAIAFSVDLGILGVWVKSPDFFPFFQDWNDTGASRGILVWLILLFTHYGLVILAVYLKHLYNDRVDADATSSTAGSWEWYGLRRPLQWIARNRHMLLDNTFGFICLLSSFVVITNAV